MVEKTQLGGVAVATIDVSKWRMKHVKKFQSASSAGDFDAVGEAMLPAIVAMPDGSDPSIEALDELTPAEFLALVKQVSDALGEAFRPQGQAG